MTVGTADLQLDSLITVILASGPGIPLLCLGSTKKWFRFFEYWLCTGGGAWRDSPVVSSPLPAASLSLACRAWGRGENQKVPSHQVLSYHLFLVGFLFSC